ncbi:MULTISPECIES: ubiquinone biosynthesis protein UbiJ [Brenneria]|uniref:Ubiquinone biosynthesis accessory factor UbiJ n=1 Tax=Brenneria nigrifluens DSM 30175 = ATCC 13028 TaxID=1121120 RepID=A0A2U1UNI5_9GAMM|nr:MULTISPECIES: SCP2 domain-containing protein [Brenneria]EHD19670.1 Sterol-binding domain protein [Brenneria sp. EniD312]PWC23235.1 SCP2 domain-containing protein [Brenneria nigrifluens DSM 30175 = ATCC 13028]QCR02933.1 SCP2 domain-containing protein [Brenneria nigrifluens DSM 30175 = ATCC 13028]
MLITSVLTASLETALNQLLFRDRGMKAARQRLHGKTLQVELSELSAPLVLIFSEQQLDVVSRWEERADCRLKTRLSVLLKLRDRQQLSSLIRSGDLIVEGDIQVAQQFIALLDLAEFDPAEWLAPYLGDVVAQGLSQTAQKTLGAVSRMVRGQRRALSEALTEEWRLAPGKLENVWFQEEIAAVEKSAESLSERLAKLETLR